MKLSAMILRLERTMIEHGDIDIPVTATRKVSELLKLMQEVFQEKGDVDAGTINECGEGLFNIKEPK